MYTNELFLCMLEDKQSNVNKNFEYIFFSLLGKSIPRDKTDE